MKKLLLSLFVGFVGIISFCSANIVSVGLNCGYYGGGNHCFKGNLYSQRLYLDQGDYLILLFDNNGALSKDFSTYHIVVSDDDFTSIINYTTGSNPIVHNIINTGIPLSSISYDIYGKSTNFNSEIFTVVFVPVSEYSSCSCPDCPICDPQYTSEQCQSVYGLVSSGLLNSCQSDLNSCQSNTSGFNDQLNNCNLSLNACNSSLTNCLQYNCPEVDYTGDLLRSNIYINNILHPGRQFVNIEIPDYITWDYSVGDDDFNLYVGSGYDVDYIESVIDINSYRPTSEDFTNVFVSGLTLVMPYIVIALFIIFVRKFIKRIFK